MAFARWACALSLGLTGCTMPSVLGEADTGTDGDDGDSGDDGDDSADGDDGSSDGSAGDDGPPPADGPPRIDFLFVVDNSGSMGLAQASLANGLEAFVEQLDAFAGISYRVGVTTTDDGSPKCTGNSPEAGKLQLTSCRTRPNEFIFNGTPAADVTDVACLDICAHDEIPLLPTAVDGDADPRPRPWIEGGAEGSNLDGMAVADALRCAMPQGIAGCGFESPLESAYKAIERSKLATEDQFGFLRDDAHLVIVFLTDESDCSTTNDGGDIFQPTEQGGNEVFWEPHPDGSDQSNPSSAVCWHAGIECTGGPGMYDECHVANKDVDGNVGVSDDEAVLQPIARYRKHLLDLQEEKRTKANASVFLFGITGVPEGYPAVAMPFADADDPMQQYDFGIGPACENADSGHIAVPAVRLLELASTFDNPVHANMFSICGDVSAALGPILESVLAHVD